MSKIDRFCTNTDVFNICLIYCTEKYMHGLQRMCINIYTCICKQLTHTHIYIYMYLSVFCLFFPFEHTSLWIIIESMFIYASHILYVYMLIPPQRPRLLVIVCHDLHLLEKGELTMSCKPKHASRASKSDLFGFRAGFSASKLQNVRRDKQMKLQHRHIWTT